METDNNLILPINNWIRLLITSINVIHSWGLYSLGLKFDGIPGIINLIYCKITIISYHYGLCYELCGLLHNFMSIRIIIYPLAASALDISKFDWFFTPNNTSSKVITITIGTINEIWW